MVVYQMFVQYIGMLYMLYPGRGPDGLFWLNLYVFVNSRWTQQIFKRKWIDDNLFFKKIRPTLGFMHIQLTKPKVLSPYLTDAAYKFIYFNHFL